MSDSPWRRSDRFDPASVAFADRHYSRQKPGTPQFVRPCSNLVLRAPRALWVSIWPDFAQHAWAGAWECQLFRNEGEGLSSELIRLAVAHTRAFWPETPALGMVTFIDAEKVRHKRDPGRCFLKAGFIRVGITKVRKRLVLQLVPASMPDADPAPSDQFAFAFGSQLLAATQEEGK